MYSLISLHFTRFQELRNPSPRILGLRLVLEKGVGERYLQMQVTNYKHKRSKSFPYTRGFKDNVDHSVEDFSQLNLDKGDRNDCSKSKKKQLSEEVKSSMKEEIMQLQRILEHQLTVRRSLEKELGYESLSQNITQETISMPEPTTDLIREIAALESEKGRLEQDLLSLYSKRACDQQNSSLYPPTRDDILKSPMYTKMRRCLQFSKSYTKVRRTNSCAQPDRQSVSNPWKETTSTTEDRVRESVVHRSRSSLTQHSDLSKRASTTGDIPGKALRACQSQPSCMMEYAQNSSSNLISLAEHFGIRISDRVPETPNKLSEDMVRCMCTIYCKLADPPLANPCLSPTSSFSSMSAFSTKDQSDIWSPGSRKDSSFDVRDNPFHVEGLKESTGPYSSMVEVQCIYKDGHRLGDIEPLLQNFRSIVSRLEVIDPGKLSHEEKLAFWINIHNALVMHAFLSYGIPQKNVKRVYLLLKAAYNVGGHVISANVIQNSILGCPVSKPGKLLRLLLSSRGKFKAGDERRTYAIEHPEPLLHFALCSGNHSDPAVRVYTPKRVFQELEAAKEEYIIATFGLKKGQKVVLPKVVESFAKDSGLLPAGVIEMIQQYLPESFTRSITMIQQKYSHKNIEYVPHNFDFRYLIMKELVKSLV
ncbi:uncharacterized protein LOC107009439 isoform X1 [Solanum pennellii]|uniref:Uncharacterized protein LOC107009439 isoform X1 n=1 Tax=Solanum pennellii TaxID=28526 RepID=A0ABM1G0N0_SOLPN|nr:uncharacterized protein LOC107009439 isoform X1 [Solanum pennellii]